MCLVSNERYNCILEVLHEVEISHGQNTLSVLATEIFWHLDSVDEVHNCSQDLWGTLLYLENIAVIPICSVEVLKSLEVSRPGIEDNLRYGVKKL